MSTDHGKLANSGDRFGITRADRRLFHGLDWEGKKFLTAKDGLHCENCANVVRI